ncbi:MAG: hypothetical protein U0231_10465 [Nitrospiraceae bacterium]
MTARTGLGVDMIVLGFMAARWPDRASHVERAHQAGTMVVTGHRDTHFRFLRDLRPNGLAGSDGNRRADEAVTQSRVMDARQDSLVEKTQVTSSSS